MQENKEEQLLFQMDRLYENSSKLNKKLYRIVRELESEAKLKMEKRYRRFTLGREHSFRSVFVPVRLRFSSHHIAVCHHTP